MYWAMGYLMGVSVTLEVNHRVLPILPGPLGIQKEQGSGLGPSVPVEYWRLSAKVKVQREYETELHFWGFWLLIHRRLIPETLVPG